MASASIADVKIDTARQASAGKLEITPLPGEFGAVVSGIEWADDSEENFVRLTRALRRHLLLVFRGQPSPDHPQLDAFFRHFGNLVSESIDGNFHYQTFTNSGQDQVHRKDAFNFVVNTEEGQTELVWHNDHFHRPQLKIMGVLEAIEFEEGAVPTVYRDMYTAYEMLPPALRAEYQFRQTTNLDPRKLDTVKWPRLADAMHPVFTRHPHSGRHALYVGDWTHRIVGYSQAESDRRLTELRDHALRNAPTYTHQWQVGDILVYDNVGLQHRRDAMLSGKNRVLRAYEGVAE